MIYLNPKSGMCNRLRAIGSALRLADEYNDSVKILWHKDAAMGCYFEDFFEEIIYVLGGKRVKVPFENVECSRKELEEKMEQKIGDICIYSDIKIFLKDYINNKGDGNFLLRTGHLFYDFGNDFSWLSPKKELQKKIQSIVRNYGDYCVGVHIRRTDHKLSIEYSPVELFIKVMDEEVKLRNAKFYLATDDMEVQRYLCDRYGERVITSNSKAVIRETKEGMEDAVIDLYALANTRKIYGSYGSTFSATAAHIGKCELEMVADVNVLKQKWEEHRKVIEAHEKIMIYGAGVIGKQVCNFLKQKGYVPCCFIVSNAEGNEKMIDGIPVIPIDQLENGKENLFILSVWGKEAVESMKENLIGCGYENILVFNLHILDFSV